MIMFNQRIFRKMKISKFKILAILSTSLLFTQGLAAQATAGASKGSIWEWMYENIIVILTGVVIIAVFGTLANMIFRLIDLQKMRMLQEMGMEPEKVISSTQESPIKKLYDWAWSIVPVGEEKNIDLGHDYDGIRELDNRLPPWWLGIMYGSIIFAGIYMYVYHWSGSDWSSRKEYDMAMEAAEEQKEAYLATVADAVDENTVNRVTDEASLANGKDIYMTNCMPCHGTMGEGTIGPNFTDEYWIHGGSIKDIFTTIKYGVPEKGMISWSSQLRPTAMQNVASYIMTLQGTNPPNGKAPEGTLYVPEENNNDAGESGNVEEATVENTGN
jgi:cytochrome c oxidase cbb3-type subunit 3